MGFKDTFGVEYSDDRQTLLKCPNGLTGCYCVSPLVTTIGKEAFKGCDLITDITFSSSIKTIESNAFDDCKSLENIRFDGSIEEWLMIDIKGYMNKSYDLFINGKLLTDVVITGTNKDIKNNAFYYCRSLKHIEIQEGVKTIGKSAFNKTNICGDLYLPNSIELIDTFAFLGCTKLRSISIPYIAWRMGKGVFRYCDNLEKVEIRGKRERKEEEFYTIDGVVFHNAEQIRFFLSNKEGAHWDESRYGQKLYHYPCGRKAKTYIIPPETESIEDYAFTGVSNLLIVFKEYIRIGKNTFLDAKVKILIPIGSRESFVRGGYPNDCLEEIDVESFIGGKGFISELPTQITLNPYRLLGIFSNASLKEITANKTKIARYASVGKSVAFGADMDGILPPVDRNEASTEKAFADLSLSQDKLRHALFWFVKDTDFDEIALGHLNAGNIDKAQELFEKRENWSSLMNRGVLSFVSGKLGEAIGYIMKVIHNDSHRSSLLLACCDDSFSMQKTEISNLFINSLKSEIDENTLLSALYYNGLYEEANRLRSGRADSIKAKINAEIEKSNQADPDKPDASYQAGLLLMNNAKQAIEELKRLLGSDEMQYQLTVDNVAKRILQCSINYHNAAGKNVDYEKALSLAEYAESIAVGKLVKERCAENLRVMKENSLHAKTKEDEKILIDKLNSTKNTPASLDASLQLVKDCRPMLKKLRETLGEHDNYYLNLSSSVANVALGMVIKVVNGFQNKRNSRRKRKMVEEALEAMEIIGGIDMTPEARMHFQKNERTLKDIAFSLNLHKQTFWDFIFDHPLIYMILVFGIIGAVIGAFSNEGDSIWESIGAGFGGGCGFGFFGWVLCLITGRIRY